MDSEDDAVVQSQSWTGGPPPRRKISAGRRRIFLATCLFGMAYSVWAVFKGLRDGLILIPFDKSDGLVSSSSKGLFVACVVGWLLMFGLMALGSLLVLRQQRNA